MKHPYTDIIDRDVDAQTDRCNHNIAKCSDWHSYKDVGFKFYLVYVLYIFVTSNETTYYLKSSTIK